MKTKLVETRQVIKNFKACKLEGSKIFELSENMSKYIFSEIHKSLLRIVKSEYFALKNLRLLFCKCTMYIHVDQTVGLCALMLSLLSYFNSTSVTF